MLPKFIDATDTPTLNVIMFSVNAGYPLHSSQPGSWYMTIKGGRRVSRDRTNTGIPHCQFHYVNAKLVS